MKFALLSECYMEYGDDVKRLLMENWDVSSLDFKDPLAVVESSLGDGKVMVCLIRSRGDDIH